MAAGDTARLLASLELDTSKFKSGVASATGGLDTLETRFKRIGNLAQQGVSNAATNIARIGIVAGGALVGAVALGARSLGELQRVEAQTDAAIASTGGAAKVSAAQIREYAQALEDTTTVDDKTIQGAENLLLTFTNIGSSVFPQATKAVVDLGIAMAQGDASNADFKSTAIQIGKALNDPITGLTALRRVGVSFTQQQQDQIKALVKSGDTLKAQKLILQELEKEFGNAGKAAGTGPEAAMRRLQDAGEDLSMALATGVLPVVEKFATWLSTKLRDPKTVQFMKQLGDEIGRAGDKLLAWVEGVDWGAIVNGARSLVGIGQAIVGAFAALPDWAKEFLAVGFVANKFSGGALGSIVGELGKGLVKGVLNMNAAVVNINAASVTGAGGLPTGAVPGAAGAAATAGGLGAGTIVSAVLAIPAAILIANAIREAAGITPEESSRRQSTGQFGPRSASNVPPELRATATNTKLTADEVRALKATDTKDSQLTVGAIRQLKASDDHGLAAIQARTAAAAKATQDVHSRLAKLNADENANAARTRSAVLNQKPPVVNTRFNVTTNTYLSVSDMAKVVYRSTISGSGNSTAGNRQMGRS